MKTLFIHKAIEYIANLNGDENIEVYLIPSSKELIVCENGERPRGLFTMFYSGDVSGFFDDLMYAMNYFVKG
jgi:hypothetical protein